MVHLVVARVGHDGDECPFEVALPVGSPDPLDLPSIREFRNLIRHVWTYNDHLRFIGHKPGDLLLTHRAAAYDDDSPTMEIEENGIVQRHRSPGFDLLASRLALRGPLDTFLLEVAGPGFLQLGVRLGPRGMVDGAEAPPVAVAGVRACPVDHLPVVDG